MPFPAALNSGQYESLRGTASVNPIYSASQYMVLGSNTTVFAARVNQVTFADSFAQITYDTVTTGAHTDLETGMTVLLSHTNDRRAAYFVGRVRKTPTSSILYINETSVAVTDNDYIFVLRDYRLFGKLGRESGGSYFKDYDLTFAAPAPLIYGLQSAYAGVVSGSPEGYTVAFTPSAIGVTSGATISSWAWTIPAGVTITVGNASSQNITVRFSASASEYWVKLIVTDSGGRASTRRFPVWAIPADLSTTVAVGFEGAAIEGSIDGGYSASAAAFTGVDTLLDNTICALVNVERYNGTEANIVSNIAFTGRIRTEANRTDSDFVYSQVQEIRYDIEGIGAQLARIAAPSIYMRNKTSATVWDELVALTFWRAMWYLLFHSTFHELHSLSFDSTDSTFRYLQLQTQGGNLFDAIADLAQSITATFEFAPQGDARVYRNLNYGTTAERNAGITVASFTEADWLNYNLAHEHIETVGAVGGDGGSYNTSTNFVIALLGNAPKVAQGNAEGTSTLSRQVLTANLSKAAAKAELAARLGHHYAFANPNDELTLEFPDGYHWLTPSNSQWYTFTITATENTGGRAYTTADRWVCQSVSIEHDNLTGTKRVQATFRLESEGTPGTAYEPPAPVQIGLNLPAIPPFPPFPPLGTPPDVYLPPNPDIGDVLPPIPPGAYIANDGNAVMVWTQNGLWVCTDYLTSSTPTWREVTPTITGSITAAAFGPVQSAYVLESDGDISVLWYTGDVFASAPTWTEGAAVIGEFDLIRPTSTPGSVYIRGQVAAATGCYPEIEAGVGVNLENRALDLGAGWWSVTTTDEGGGGATFYAQIFIPGCCVLADYEIIGGTNASVGNRLAWNCGEDDDFDHTGDYGVGNCLKRVLFRAFEECEFQFQLSSEEGCEGAGINTGVVLFTDDFGATWSDEYNPASGGGIDTIKIGDGALIGNADEAELADADDVVFATYGSAFPAGTSPGAIHIPRLTFTGASNINTDTPVYLGASPDLSASDEALWKVTATGATFTDITPDISGDFFEAVGANCIHMPWNSASRMAVIGMFDTEVHLMTSSSAGAVWADRGELDATASYIRFRKGDKTGRQLYYTDGAPGYSPDFGANLYAKSHPDPLGSTLAPLLGIEPWSAPA